MITRQEFSKKLDAIFCISMKCKLVDIVCALVKNDVEKITEFSLLIDECEKKKLFYLNLYDEAATDEIKKSVIGSVDSTIEMN